MYISRRVDIIGPPVWKSIIAPRLSKSELASLRLWQSERQRCTLSPLHHHTLTPPGYPTAPSCTQNPSDVEHDTCSLRSLCWACDQTPPCRRLRKSASGFNGSIDKPWLDGGASEAVSSAGMGLGG